MSTENRKNGKAGDGKNAAPERNRREGPPRGPT